MFYIKRGGRVMKYIGILAAMVALVFTSCGGGDNMSASSSYPKDYYSNENSYYNYYQNFGYPGYYPPTGKYYMNQYDANQYERGYNNNGYVKGGDADMETSEGYKVGRNNY